MAEIRRITKATVDWAAFDAGKVIAISTGDRRINKSGEDGLDCTPELRVFSVSGVLLSYAQLPDIPDGGLAAATNASDVLACCATHDTGKEQRSTLSFVFGPQTTVHELQCSKSKRKVARHSIVSIRSGQRDIAIYSFGGSEVFSCTRRGHHCNVQILYDFKEIHVVGIIRGRISPELIVLLDDGSVAVMELFESSEHLMACTITQRLPVSSTAIPTKAVFAGGRVLWVMCDDYSLCAYWFPPSEHYETVAGNEEGVQGGTVPLRLLDEQLSIPAESQSTGRIFLAGEGRGCSVHIAVQSPTSINFSSLALRSANGPRQPPTPAGWSHSAFVWSGYLHDLDFRQQAYELLVQSELGGSSLNIISLRQNASVLIFGELHQKQLCHQVVCAAPSQLAALRVECESRVQELEVAAANASSKAAVETAMRHLLDLQHCMVATLHRERELNEGCNSYQSVSMLLIRRLHTVFIRLSVYCFFYAVGAEERLDVPLRDALGLESARLKASSIHLELRTQFQQEFDLQEPVSSLEMLKLWGSQDAVVSLCIDAILLRLKCNDVTALRDIVRQMTSMTSDMALLVLYCSFKGKDCYTNDENRTICMEFLNRFCFPVSLHTWAYLAYAADHSISPADARHAIGCPSSLSILPGILNGLARSGAYETVYNLIGSVLSLTTRMTLPPSVAVRLLYLAYKRGNMDVLEILYRRSGGTEWRSCATHVLAWAVAQTASVKPLGGLIIPQSPEEEIIESVLRRRVDPCIQDVLLLDFYILMQRYADALEACSRITSCRSADAQKVQVIASHLRSLMPNGNESFSSRPSAGLTGDTPVGTAALAARSGWATLASTPSVSCPLHNEEQQLESDVARIAARISSLRPRENTLDAAMFAASHKHDVGNISSTPSISRAEMRSESAAVSQLREGAAEDLSIPSPLTQGSDSNTVLNASLLTQPPHGSNSTMTADTVPPSAAVGLGREPLYCEAILKRSKKPCGRVRPCEYHDRSRR
uniref:Uncharacterized protein TCIL3000_11_15900 n=1 Tax=Trypanosoma congolense (strain IL3000) TaxID=1068625 RepID=G0V357_TRYCI|nr:unnamed protein product [Trypanosoma congolense IL3000]